MHILFKNQRNWPGTKPCLTPDLVLPPTARTCIRWLQQTEDKMRVDYNRRLGNCLEDTVECNGVTSENKQSSATARLLIISPFFFFFKQTHSF